MAVPLIDLVRQYQSIKSEIDDAVQRVWNHGQFVLGREVKAFEEMAAQKCGADHAIGVASGSDALLLTMHALGIGPGDEVLVPTFTFFATASCVSRLGAKPVFCDIGADFNLDPADAARRITPRTRAAIVVELYGQMADMAALRELTYERGIALIEDAAQSIGSTFEGVPAGSCGDAACFSFFPTKNLGAAGDGGMVTTNDPELAERVRILRQHGAHPKYYHKLVGYNSRLDGLQAAILQAKLPHLDRWTEKRRHHADVYDRELAGVGDIKIPIRRPNAYHIFHQYTITTSRRDELRAHLQAAKIGTEIYYPLPLHLQECYAYLGGKPGLCPVAEQAARTALSLPIFPEMTASEQSEVIDTIKRFFA
jgi:dTDP-4-amino-4,6-dideoxygalactose transaminase